MDTQKLIARLRERAATQDACGCWSLDRAVADELERQADELAALRHTLTNLLPPGTHTIRGGSFRAQFEVVPTQCVTCGQPIDPKCHCKAGRDAAAKCKT